jgi:3-oxoadipate enol-lactonase
MPRIALGDTTLNYVAMGDGPEWLVLLHEIGGTLETWSAVMPTLARRFRVIAYDQRGAGSSDRIVPPFSVETHVEDLRRLLQALGAIGPVHLAGVAIGCAIALRYVERFPQDVRSLVLACPAPSVSEDRRRYLDRRAGLVEREGMGAVAESTLANSYPPEAIRDRAVYDAYRARFLANDPKSYAALNRAFADFDAATALAQITCPVLVLAGEHDKLRPPDFVRDFAARILGARCTLIPSGHIMPVQAPDAMLAAMDEFYR